MFACFVNNERPLLKRNVISSIILARAKRQFLQNAGRPAADPTAGEDASSRKSHDKKILRQVLGVLRRMSEAANERKDRSPVYFAKFRQRRVHLLRAAVRVDAGKHNAPACRFETTV